MPLYQYQVILPEGEDPEDGMVFEIMQKITDPPLETHPALGLPVRRILTAAPAAGGAWGERREKSNLSDASLAAKGITKYVKTGDGTYEKTTGGSSQGPDKISA